MRKAILILILAIIACGMGGYYFIKERIKTDLALNAKVSRITEKIDNIRNSYNSLNEKVKQFSVKGARSIEDAVSKVASPGNASAVEGIEIHLKHGAVIKGKLVKTDGKSYTVESDGREFTVDAPQIAKVKYITQRDAEWPYANDMVIKKTNGIISDGKIIAVNDKDVTMSFEEGGGVMEMTIPRSDISYLVFAPVYTKDTEATEKDLKDLFPKMKMYKNGNVTIFTDSYEKTAKWYENIVLTKYTEIYFKFFPLFKDRKPRYQNFLVIFDSPLDYTESTGVIWFVPGFFDPDEKVLYLYNMFGEQMETFLFEALAGAAGEVDKSMENFKKHYEIDKRYDEFLDGWAKEDKDRYWKVYNLYKRDFVDSTKETLRHELTHEVFHNWGLQTIIMSKPNMDKEKIKETRKRFIETKDWQEKRKLLDEMAKLDRSDETEMAVAGSWLAEGLATYCATDKAGDIQQELLFLYQDSARKKEASPIEFFTNFEKGSFVGTAMEAKRNLYAQSWAFTNFLMGRYPAQFIDYQKRMADLVALDKDKTAAKDDLAVLLTCLNKDLPSLEKEFSDYMNAYPKMDDPFVKSYMEHYEVWKDLLKSSR